MQVFDLLIELVVLFADNSTVYSDIRCFLGVVMLLRPICNLLANFLKCGVPCSLEGIFDYVDVGSLVIVGGPGASIRGFDLPVIECLWEVQFLAGFFIGLLGLLHVAHDNVLYIRHW